MQDRFVGDIGDFGKYGLLRALAGIRPRAEPLLPLGIAWYIPDDDTVKKTPSGHGQRIEYLFNPRLRDRYRSCDKQLFNRLKQIVCCRRDIKAVEDSGLLGDSARGEVVFHSDQIPAIARRDARAAWFRGACEKVDSARIVFLDPDTGLADSQGRAPRRNISYGLTRAPRYAFVCELEELIGPARTIAWYQSFGWNRDHEGQAREWRIRLRQAPRLGDRPLHILKHDATHPEA